MGARPWLKWSPRAHRANLPTDQMEAEIARTSPDRR
jgi:hypothetical protein